MCQTCIAGEYVNDDKCINIKEWRPIKRCNEINTEFRKSQIWAVVSYCINFGKEIMCDGLPV